jgi:NDP-sugar pyrophosphorylase family protein
VTSGEAPPTQGFQRAIEEAHSPSRPRGAVVAVVPAAGVARRLQPLTGSKELISVHRRPVMDYLVDRMRQAACTELRVVTRPEKHDVIEHALQEGLSVVTGRPESVADSIALGVGDLDGDAAVLLGFPDTIWGPADGFSRLLDQLVHPYDVVLGLFRTRDLGRSDVVTVEEDDRVVSIEVKPTRPRSTLIWGCAAARAGALTGLRGVTEPSELFQRLARRGAVTSVYLSDYWIDIGTPDGLASARQLEPVG